eukprot:TRINITY_DN1949_c0_g1_i1.p1 TRINITY_DN1949_c0_g1~~TRINITY_DN1949_c0_g1_i1.p1  ORF type:complete len:753 (+),score=266.44 TRINITY_DN1949_c0_g1_i1:166-2424(+)
MYVRRGGVSLYPPPRIACFVCGSCVPSDYPLFTENAKGSLGSRPHFPFLKSQQSPCPEGVAKSCRVCYNMLMSQWDDYERNGVPLDKRVYWLKRGAENSSTPSAEPARILPPPPPRDNDSPLDLSPGSRDRDTLKSRSSLTSNPSSVLSTQGGSGGLPCLPYESTAQPTSSGSSSSSDQVADLALPDKNASHEVCYVCGDEYKKGTLSYSFAKLHSAKEPFYPSLLRHPRPPRSRPIDPAGRVLACDKCRHHLHIQWTQFESEEVPHTDRNYSLRKRDPSLDSQDSTIFVCYICSLDYHSSCLRLLYCRANPDNEPYYPFIENQSKPPGASSISPQGMVQVCMVCYQSIKEKHRGVLKSSNSAGSTLEHQQQPPPKKRKSNLRPSEEVEVIGGSIGGVPYGDAVAEEHELPEDIGCPLCKRKFSIGSFRLLHVLPPPAGGVPYFPFLESLHFTEEERAHLTVESPKKRVRACRSCTTSLMNQWTQFTREQVPLDKRDYTYSSLTYHTRRPSPKEEKDPPTSIRPRSNSNLESIGRSASPRHSPSSSRSEPCRVSTSSSSFYCFLCGLHSELSFSRVLYSSAPAKKAPYFPFMKLHVPKPRAETLREDGTALVCTFCYHSVMAQWSKHNESKACPDANQRKYDIHTFICYVCCITTYRKRIRALRVVDFPFLRQHKSRNKNVISMENGEMVAVCLDCFESLRGQFTEGAKYGIPVNKRQYNWIQIPPPPPEDPHMSTPQERLHKVERKNTTVN